MKSLTKLLVCGAHFLVSIWFVGELRAEDGNIDGKDACLAAARGVVPLLERSEFGRRDGKICDEDETGFLQFRVSYRSDPRIPMGLTELFWQRTPGHLSAISEGREPRLSFEIIPFDATNIWAITVTDSSGNKRENLDFIWARDLRDAIDGGALAQLILGEPLVYFACTRREGLTCVAYYTIDKCYGDPEYPRGNSASNRRYFHLSVAAVGTDNVERMLSNYSPVNILSEKLLQIVTPAACAYEQFVAENDAARE